jgi:RNA polymerase sigma factor (sigma-70 family)
MSRGTPAAMDDMTRASSAESARAHLSLVTPAEQSGAAVPSPLLPRIAAGDEGAVRECVSRYGALVWSLARRWSAESGDAEDAVQEIFIDLWRTAARYDLSRTSEAGWVAMIARRRLIDRARKRERLPVMESIPEDFDVASETERDLDREWRAEQARARLTRITTGATPHARAVAGVRPDARRNRSRNRHTVGHRQIAHPPRPPARARRAGGADPERRRRRIVVNDMDDERLELELVAAELTAVLIADGSAPDELPAALSARLISAGEVIVRSQPRVVPITRAAPPTTRSTLMAWSGWFAAAAALLLWFAPPRALRPTETPIAVRAAGDSTAQLRNVLLTRDSTTQRLAWTATTDSTALGASGDVVWSGRTQRGVMRLAGLQPNDRLRWQYQLWIFDKTRDQKYPVDGGVFDIPAGKTEVLVPINARVPVGDAVMFAVTVEPAGGVVVSARERIALLAQRGT